MAKFALKTTVPCLLGAFLIAGCSLYSGDEWPSLTRPGPGAEAESTSPAPAEDAAAPPPPDRAVAAPDIVDALRTLTVKLMQHESDLERIETSIRELDGDYRSALAELARDGGLEAWNSAQLALSRLSSGTAALRRHGAVVAEDAAEAARLLSRAPGDAQVGKLVITGGALYGRIRDRHAEYSARALAEAGRLGALRPDAPAVADGDGEAAREAEGRALVTIPAVAADIAFEADLRAAVAAARARFPDIVFDVLALGPAGSAGAPAAMEAVLERVLRVLIELDAAPARVLRRQSDDAAPAEVRILVR